MPITVGNDDIDNLMVTTSLGATARGVVVTDDGSAPPFRPDQVQIFSAADGSDGDEHDGHGAHRRSTTTTPSR